MTNEKTQLTCKAKPPVSQSQNRVCYDIRQLLQTTQAGLNASKEAQNYWKVSFYNIANFFFQKYDFWCENSNEIFLVIFCQLYPARLDLAKTTLLCEITYMYYDNLFRLQRILLSVVG